MEDTNELIQDMLFNSPGWKATNRMGALAEMHHIFIENYRELMGFMLKLHDIQGHSKELLKETYDKLNLHIFNFLASTKALTDNCRAKMKFYEGTDLWNKYQAKVEEVFCVNLLSMFVQNLRNYQTHHEMSTFWLVRSLKDNTKCDIVFITEDLLKGYSRWDKQAKEYMALCGEEVNLREVSEGYFRLTDTFYTWLYAELNEYHRDDFAERDGMIKKLGMAVQNMPK